MKKMKKSLVLFLVFLTVGALLFAGGKKETAVAEDGALRVAMVLTGPINDAGWNESAYVGMMNAKEMYNLRTSYSENVPMPDFETVIRDYAERNDLVICHGFEFSDPVKRIAPLYPNVKFAVVNGNTFQEPNMISFRFNTTETGFLAGAAAGLFTKSNIIGMIGGEPFPHVEDALNSFKAGAEYVNPQVRVILGYVNSWSDVPKGKEMAMSMIDQGADVLSANANAVSLGVIDAAQSRRIKHIGYVGDQHSLSPDTVVVSAIQSVEEMMGTIIGLAMENKLVPQLYLMGHKEGVIRFSSFYGNEKLLPSRGMDKLNEVSAGIKDGSLKNRGIMLKSVFER